MKNKLVPVAVIALIAVSFGSILARLSSSSALTISFWRMAIATFLLLVYGLLFKVRLSYSLNRKEKLLLLASGIALTAHFYFWITSLKWTTVAHSTVLVSTHVIFVSLGERFLNKRSLSPLFILSLALAFIGVGLIANVDLRSLSTLPLKGDLYALIGGFAAGCYFFAGSQLRQKMPIVPYSFLVNSIATIALGLILVIVEGAPSFIQVPKMDWLWFSLLAIGPQIMGHTLLNYLLAFIRPTFLTLSILTEPVGATIWAILIFNEIPKPLSIIGGLLILSSLILAPRSEARI